MPGCSQKLGDDEFLYRRISHRDYDPNNSLPVAPIAFRPRQDDANGLSLDRAKYVPLRVAGTSKAQPSKHFYVGRLRVGDLLKEGMQLGVDSTNKAHVLITNLNFGNRAAVIQSQWQVKLAHELCAVLDPKDIGSLRACWYAIACWLRRILC